MRENKGEDGCEILQIDTSRSDYCSGSNSGADYYSGANYYSGTNSGPNHHSRPNSRANYHSGPNYQDRSNNYSGPMVRVGGQVSG